jgi:hypothetical protein
MLHPDDIPSFDDVEDPAELVRALPEIRQNLAHAVKDDELGLRSLLEWPELGRRTPPRAA